MNLSTSFHDKETLTWLILLSSKMLNEEKKTEAMSFFVIDCSMMLIEDEMIDLFDKSSSVSVVHLGEDLLKDSQSPIDRKRVATPRCSSSSSDKV